MAYNTGATFYPGGEDSYYMPEVVSPAPQRLNEHPVNIEQNVANMEQQAASRSTPQLSIQPTMGQQPNNHVWSPVSPAHNLYPQTTYTQDPYNNVGSAPSPQPQTSYGQITNVQQPPQQPLYQSATYSQAEPKSIPDVPNFSVFPKVQNRGPNIPETPEEQEARLEAARNVVLGSNDADTQLTWAQDALNYVEVAEQNEQRISQTQPARPRTPRVERMLKDDAMRILEFLAEQYQPKADFIRGMWYEFGKFGYRTDKREAFNCYQRASDKGYYRAFYRIGMQFENSNDALKAVKYYQIGASHGDAASCYRLGMMTLLGQQGQMQDFTRGLQLISAAADAADENAPQGAYVLGMLLIGEFTLVSIPDIYLKQNIYEAKKNIEKAAFMGFAKAQVRMGLAYEFGDLDCPPDPALALHYHSLAARQGEVDAEMSICKWFLCGHPGVFAKNEQLAFTYAQRAAVRGSATAQFAMGYFYEVGIYVQSDLKQAREWYQKSSEGGYEQASGRITAISRSKTISRKDHESVAVQRIRQQYAGANNSLPTPQEHVMSPPPQAQSPTITMPDPSRLSLNASNAQQRPSSVAPYPMEAPGMLSNPNFRPASAFGINPALQQRPQSSMQGPIPRIDSYHGSPPPIAQQAGFPPNYGPGGRHPGPPRPPYGNAYGGSPNPAMSPTSPHPGPQQFPPQRPTNGQQGPNIQAPPTPKVNIGFSAPPDPKGADRRNDQRRRPVPGQQGQGQSQMQGQQPQNRPPQKAPENNSIRPPRTDSVQPARLEPSRPPRADSVTPKPSQQKPAKVSASAAASRPPGKGPKTFEEMGVPQARKESDCVVM